MENNKTSAYFKYAIGEIVLVVIGILIALQINNWNIKRQEKNLQAKIYERILDDMDNDIEELSSIINYLDSIKPVFEKVRHDSIAPDLLDQGISRILTTFYMTSLNKTGVNQLKETINKDSLSIQIIEIYDLMENVLIIPYEKQLMQEVKELTYKFREYPWYAEWMSKTIMKDNSSKVLQDYFLTSMEYKHNVIFFYQIMYNNYYPGLQTSIATLINLSEEIKKTLKN